MGKYGFKSGYGEFQNIQAGITSVSDTSGTDSVSFDESMKSTPSVVVKALTDTRVWVTTRSASGFSVGRNDTSSSVKISWIAMDDSQNI